MGGQLSRPADADQAELLLPLAFHEHVELLRSSPAISAALRRRVEQMITFGHSPEADLEQPIDHFVREAEARLRAFIDWTGRNCMHVPPARRDQLFGKVENAIALLLAAWERMAADTGEFSTEEGNEEWPKAT